jgi:hypothetical protein
MSSPRRPSPEPLEANDRLVAAVGSAGWAIALIVLLAVRTQLPASDRWWIWTCATGLGLGLFGLLYVPILKRSRARAAERRAQARLRYAWSSDSKTVSSIDTPGVSTRS